MGMITLASQRYFENHRRSMKVFSKETSKRLVFSVAETSVLLILANV
jgi:hypothetical protein